MKRVLMGCGIVMALGLVAVIVVSVVSYSWWKNNAPDTQHLEEVRADLADAYGEPEAYHPPLDGSLDGDRVAIYVGVRESMVGIRDSLSLPIGEFLAEVAVAENEDMSAFEGIRSGLKFTRDGIRIFGYGVDYITRRAERLREVGMGEGEYAYLDALALHSYLDWDPVRIVEEDPVAEDRDMVEGADVALDRQRDLMIDQLRNARREIERLESPSLAQQEFLERIETTLAFTRDERGAFPFQDGLADVWRETLDRFRSRIERTLPRDAAGTLLEEVDHLLDEEQGGFSFDVER